MMMFVLTVVVVKLVVKLAINFEGSVFIFVLLLVVGSAAELVFSLEFILLKKSGEVNKFSYALLFPRVLLFDEDDAWNEKRELY